MKKNKIFWKVKLIRTFHEGMNGFGMYPNNQVTINPGVYAEDAEAAEQYVRECYGDDVIILEIK